MNLRGLQIRYNRAGGYFKICFNTNNKRHSNTSDEIQINIPAFISTYPPLPVRAHSLTRSFSLSPPVRSDLQSERSYPP